MRIQIVFLLFANISFIIASNSNNNDRNTNYFDMIFNLLTNTANELELINHPLFNTLPSLQSQSKSRNLLCHSIYWKKFSIVSALLDIGFNPAIPCAEGYNTTAFELFMDLPLQQLPAEVALPILEKMTPKSCGLLLSPDRIGMTPLNYLVLSSHRELAFNIIRESCSLDSNHYFNILSTRGVFNSVAPYHNGYNAWTILLLSNTFNAIPPKQLYDFNKLVVESINTPSNNMD